MSSTTVVIPLRGLHGGKSRLAPVFDPAQRATLIAAMARHVTRAVIESGIAADILIVTREHDLLARAGIDEAGLRVVVQPETSHCLNAAIETGRTQSIAAGASQLVVLSADLPILHANDLQALAGQQEDVVLSPDRLGLGTNALALNGHDAIERFRFHFGAGSRKLHRAEALRLRLTTSAIMVDGIALDLDTPDDWAALTGPERLRLLNPSSGAHQAPYSHVGPDPIAYLERA